jgi:hypothetical protein
MSPLRSEDGPKTPHRECEVPCVSVLMTIYDAGPYLRMSLESLIAQNFQAWELIAVENGSRDGSAAILASYADDPRIRAFFLKTNIGRTPALRYAFAQARGKYIAVLDADDKAHPQRLQKQVQHLESHPETVLLGTWVDYINSGDAVIGELTPPTQADALLKIMAAENPIVHSSAMYRAATALAVGGYPEDRPYAQDYGLWLRLVSRGKAAVLPERLAQFRILPSSMTRSRTRQVEVTRDLLHSTLDAGRMLNLCEEGRRLNREAIAIARLRYAVALARNRRISDGLLAVYQALIQDPISMVNNRVTRGFFGH